MNKFRNIKAKVVVLFSVVMIVFTATLLLTVYVSERDRLLEIELEKSTEISITHAKILNQEISKYITMLKMLSGAPQLKDESPSNIVQHLIRLVDISDGDFINAVYVDSDLNLIDAKGGSTKVTHPLFLKGDQWLNKEFNITVPIMSAFEDAPVIMVVVPIRNLDKNWIGTIAAAVPLGVISSKLSSIKLTKGSFAWLADANGVIVSHPNKNAVMSVNLEVAEDLGFPGFYKIFEQTKTQNSGFGQYQDTNINQTKIVTFSKIENLPGWTLFVTTNESEIFQDIYSMLYDILIITVVLVLVFLLLISRLSNRITQPIIKLTEEVKAGVDNRHRTLGIIDTDDEIGQLSRVFSETIGKINLHTNHLEKLVEQRTAEVTSRNIMLSKQNDQLEQLASKDSLTGLYNRRAFTTLVEKEVSRARRHNLPVTLVVLDIDHFKKINDQFGHSVGDDVLCRIAKELTQATRKENTICRWGGEEFVILVPEANSDLVFQQIEHIRSNMLTLNFDPVDSLTFSAGMATLLSGESFPQWFHRADKALYEAKSCGRNRTVVS
ncbi:diguanylate cyclase [Alginatibacterium sediminis]|uniref:diguanylate cyclase n=1 Tax=Alginatibacterium sediminis TaxID=2164068 RepID=A0A420ENL2_9ALTE|nr:diguanylate cyclase [Alginatibacterium sediminis]RKF22176.1 diguanylate cyclase [Alginatibacterium sediminis]